MAAQQSKNTNLRKVTFLRALGVLCAIVFVAEMLVSVFYSDDTVMRHVSHAWTRSHVVANRKTLQGNAISSQLDYRPKLRDFCKDFEHYAQSRNLRREYFENIHSSLSEFNLNIERNREAVLNSTSFLNSTYDFNRFSDRKRYIMEKSYSAVIDGMKNETWIKVTRFMHKLTNNSGETDVVSRSLRNPMFHIYLDPASYNWKMRNYDFTAIADLNQSLCPVPLNSVHARKINEKFLLSSRIFLMTVPHGAVSAMGHVWSRHLYIVTAGCPLQQGPTPGRRQMGPLGGYTPRYDEVFVMSQWFSRAFYHFNMETFPRIAPYLMFLKRNPTVLIHVPHDRANLLRPYIAMLGINASRIIWGDMKVKLIYLPQGGGCLQFANPIALQLASNLYLDHLSRPVVAIPRTSIVLIQRSGERKLLQHTDIAKALEAVAARTNKELVIFSDDPSPSVQMTQRVFYSAAVIVGSHGAGLANMVWAPPPVAVIEVRCATIIPCFALNAQMLGHRYYGIHPAGGCKEGINVNVTHLANVVQFILDNGELHH